jgi:hypothetical protein
MRVPVLKLQQPQRTLPVEINADPPDFARATFQKRF